MLVRRFLLSVLVVASALLVRTAAADPSKVQPVSRSDDVSTIPTLTAPAVPKSLDTSDLPKPIASPAWLDSVPETSVPETSTPEHSLPEPSIPETGSRLRVVPAPSYRTGRSQPRGTAGRTWISEDTSFLLPIITVETSGPAEVNKNGKAEFKITVTNAGDSTVDDALLVVRLPDLLRFKSSVPAPTVQRNNLLHFRIGAIKAKEKRNIVLSTIPVRRGTARVDTSLQLAASSNLTVRVREPVLKIEVSGPNKAIYGRPLSHKVRVTNTGDGPASNVRIRQLLPQGVVVTPGADRPLGDVGWLETGASEEVHFRSVAKTTGNLNFQFVAVADGDVEKRTSVLVKVVRPMLKLEVTGPRVTYLRRSATYTVLVTNPGDAVAENVRVVMHLPRGLHVTALDRPAEFDRQRETLRWVFPHVSAGGSEVMRFKANTTQQGQLLQRVTAVANDGVTSETKRVTHVLSRADLRIQIANGVGPMEVGARSIIGIEVENRGTQAARNVAVRVRLADTLDVAASSDYQFQGGLIQFNSISLAPGQKHVLQLHVKGKRRGEHVVRAMLQSNASSHELTAEATVFVYGDGPRHIADREDVSPPKELRLR